MPLIEREDKTPRVELKVKLDERTVAEFHRYCAWLDSSTEHCLEAILKRHFGQDKEWQVEKAAQGGKVIAVAARRGRRAKAEQVA